MGRVSREARLCFILLWTLADDAGRLRGDSRMLASLLYPYDDDAKSLMGGWLAELEREKCIRRYSVNGDEYIEICNWLTHQKIDKPSKSKIPAFVEPSRILANPRERSSWDQGSEDQGPKDQGSGSGARARDDETEHAQWEFTIAAYPPDAQRSDLIGAERAARRLVEDGSATWADLRLAVERYAASCKATNRLVMNPVKFFSAADKPWSQAWPIPVKAQSQTDTNISAGLTFLRGTGT